MAINLPIISEWNPAGIDKAIADFKKLETKGEKAAFAIQKAALPAGLALAAIGAVALDAVKAFAEDDAAAQKLAGTLKNVTGASDSQVKSVEDFISSTSMAAAVADDELRPALDSLVRGTGDITKAQELLGLALDVSTGTGKDLGTVADALSKAFNGNLGPLEKLDPALADLIDSGASVDEVFKAMGDTFSGQAATAADTTQGKIKNLGIQMGELKESIGEAVAPLVEKLLPKFLEFADFAKNNTGVIVGIGTAIAVIATSILLLNTGLAIYNTLTAVTAALNTALTTTFSALWVASGAILIVAVVAALVALQLKFNIFGVAVKVMKTGFEALWGAIKVVFNWVKDNWPLLLAIITGPFGLAVLAIIKYKDEIVAFLGDMIEWIGTAFRAVLDLIMWPFNKAYEGILAFKNKVMDVFNGLRDLAGKIFEGIGKAFKGVINAVIDGLEGGLNFAIKGLNIILNGIDSAAGPWVNFGEIPPVTLNRLAEGGIVTSPQIAMIGEGGEPEAIIPLSKLASMGFGGGQGNTITINVNGGDPNSVVRALQQYVRLNGAIPITTRAM
jgi:hypothetical protein